MSYDTYKSQAKPVEVGRHGGGAKARSLAMVWSVIESRRSEERLPKAAERVNALNQFTGLMVPFFRLCPWSIPLAWQTQLCGDRNFIIITPLMISAMPRMLGASSF